jgi:hypothetical protein
MDKVFYNEASASKLGWSPEWFDCDDFDDDLVAVIKKWQRKVGLTADGLFGPSSYRVKLNERLEDIDSLEPTSSCEKEDAYIVHAGNFIPINWPKVVLWSEEGGLKLSKGYTPYFEPRDINMFVNHWDVCLDSKTCARVLANRGISVHFCIDNDGTIYQLLDTNHAAWHAGGRSWNHSSVGVEISNAYYTKYQDWYEKKGFGKRPIVSGEKVHGRSMKDFTDFYPVQIEALKALWEAIHNGIGVPLETPVDENGETLKIVSKEAEANKFKGFVSHYHLTRRKIDCAGLDIAELLKQIK